MGGCHSQIRVGPGAALADTSHISPCECTAFSLPFHTCPLDVLTHFFSSLGLTSPSLCRRALLSVKWPLTGTAIVRSQVPVFLDTEAQQCFCARVSLLLVLLPLLQTTSSHSSPWFQPFWLSDPFSRLVSLVFLNSSPSHKLPADGTSHGFQCT